MIVITTSIAMQVKVDSSGGSELAQLLPLCDRYDQVMPCDIDKKNTKWELKFETIGSD